MYVNALSTKLSIDENEMSNLSFVNINEWYNQCDVQTPYLSEDG